MKFLLNKFIVLFFVSLFIYSCASLSSRPKQYSNICTLLDNNISWYKELRYIEKEYEVDMSTILAFIKQESSFNATAKPPIKKLFNTIPLGRASSSYGYAQAKDETWEWYQQKTGNTVHKRDVFAHSAEFVAWYIKTTQDINAVSVTDVYNQYLAYHEGHTGYKNKTFSSKSWLLNVAHKVDTTAKNYQTTLKTCRSKLDDTYGWSYL